MESNLIQTILLLNFSLIHAGSGGIGLAAIRIALAYEMEVFTTVSTPQKKKFIMDLYPQLKGMIQAKEISTHKFSLIFLLYFDYLQRKILETLVIVHLSK